MNRSTGTVAVCPLGRTALIRTLLLMAMVVGARIASAQGDTIPPTAPALDSAAVAPVPGVADTTGASATASPSEPTPAGTLAAPNPRLTGVRRVRLIGTRNVVRSGPGDGYSIAGVYPDQSEFTVIAKSGAWYNIRLSDTETAWINASLCKEFDDLSGLEFRPNRKLYSRTGSFVLSGYAGGYAFDRKSNSLVRGGGLGYYVFDRLVVQGGLGWTHVHRPAEIVESLFGLTLEAEDFHMLFYQLNATWELLPGRQMVPFLSSGVGSAIMQGESEPSVNFGAGTTLYLSKRSAMRWEVRDYRFTSGSTKARRNNNNIEFTLGSQVLF